MGRAEALLEPVWRARGAALMGVLNVTPDSFFDGGRYLDEGSAISRLDQLCALHPENVRLAELSEETRVIVSEPLGDLEDAWNAVPESSWGFVRAGHDELHPFRPERP